MEERCLSERLLDRLGALLRRYREPFLSTLVTGLMAHMFALTNKLPNHDDVLYLFDKGGTVSSGRWGLELMRLIFPDYSLPWLWGALSLLIMSAAMCLLTDLFELRGRLPRLLLPALFISFPSQTAIMLYTFTCGCYAVGFLLAVLAVCALRRGGAGRVLPGLLAALLAAAVYQAYLGLLSTLLLLLLIKDILAAGERDRAGVLLKRGLSYLGFLLAALALYGLSLGLSLRLWGTELNAYSNQALETESGLGRRLLLTYVMFFYNISSRFQLLIVSRYSRLLHGVCILAACAGLIAGQLRARSLQKTLLLALCLGLLPPSVCCMYLAADLYSVHAIVLYPYACLYILVFLALDGLPRRLRNAGKDLTALALALIVAVNVTFANRCTLKLHLEYESAYSLTTTLLAQIRSLPGYTKEHKLAIYRFSDQYGSFNDAFGEAERDLIGLRSGLLFTPAHEESFLRNFLDAEIPVASEAETEALARDRRTAELPCYPDEGSIRLIDGYVFVKFSEYEEKDESK